MRDLEEAAADYLDSDRFKNINYDEDWKNKLTLEIEKETKIAFKAGVEFAQRWISVEDELPTEYTHILFKTDDAGLYLGMYCTAKEYGNWFENIYEADIDDCVDLNSRCKVTHWRPIEIK